VVGLANQYDRRVGDRSKYQTYDKVRDCGVRLGMADLRFENR
jgi:hypothetical protein